MIEHAIRCAASAPSGAHRQPWTFVAISAVEVKKRFGEAAEEGRTSKLCVSHACGMEGGTRPSGH